MSRYQVDWSARMSYEITDVIRLTYSMAGWYRCTLTHWCQETHICVSKLGHQWFRKYLFVSLLGHFWLIHLFYLHLLYQPYVGLCQATRVQSHQRVNVGSSYSHMRGPGVGCWLSDRSIYIMACRLLGAKPLYEPILTYSQLEPKEQDSVKY